ncbi:TPA: hypothetical protein LVN11_000786 [Klebsiella oxytoca]|nr:hypothetical protein [Klebsiella oxytoca]
MGFLSLENDYVENNLIAALLSQFHMLCQTIEASAGYALIDLSLRPKQGGYERISFYRSSLLSSIKERALITFDGHVFWITMKSAIKGF